jgi:hypothetical protein
VKTTAPPEPLSAFEEGVQRHGKKSSKSVMSFLAGIRQKRWQPNPEANSREPFPSGSADLFL